MGSFMFKYNLLIMICTIDSKAINKPIQLHTFFFPSLSQLIDTMYAETIEWPRSSNENLSI
jgi:hypothetical protein